MKLFYFSKKNSIPAAAKNALVELESAAWEGERCNNNDGDASVTVPFVLGNVLRVGAVAASLAVLLVVGEKEGAENEEKEREKVFPGEFAELSEVSHIFFFWIEGRGRGFFFLKFKVVSIFLKQKIETFFRCVKERYFYYFN